MPTEQLSRILISGGLGAAIGAADLCGLYFTVKYSMKGDFQHKIPLAFFISEIVRLFIVLTLLLVLSFDKSISFGWLVAGPLLFTLIKYAYAFKKLHQL